MLEHRRRPHAHDTYTGGVPCLSSLFLEIGDFSSKDESGNALLASWLQPVLRRNGPQVTAKIMQMSDMAKRMRLFLSHFNLYWPLSSKEKVISLLDWLTNRDFYVNL